MKMKKGMFDILGIIMNPNLVPQIHNLFKIEQKVMDFLPLYHLETLYCITSRIDSPSPLGRKGGCKCLASDREFALGVSLRYDWLNYDLKYLFNREQGVCIYA